MSWFHMNWSQSIDHPQIFWELILYTRHHISLIQIKHVPSLKKHLSADLVPPFLKTENNFLFCRAVPIVFYNTHLRLNVNQINWTMYLSCISFKMCMSQSPFFPLSIHRLTLLENTFLYHLLRKPFLVGCLHSLNAVLTHLFPSYALGMCINLNN